VQHLHGTSDTLVCARARAWYTMNLYTSGKCLDLLLGNKCCRVVIKPKFHSRALTATITREEEIILLPRAATRAINVNLDARLNKRSENKIVPLLFRVASRHCYSIVLQFRIGFAFDNTARCFGVISSRFNDISDIIRGRSSRVVYLKRFSKISVQFNVSCWKASSAKYPAEL